MVAPASSQNFPKFSPRVSSQVSTGEECREAKTHECILGTSASHVLTTRMRELMRTKRQGRSFICQPVSAVDTHNNNNNNNEPIERERGDTENKSALTCVLCPSASSASIAQCSCQHTRTTCSADVCERGGRGGVGRAAGAGWAGAQGYTPNRRDHGRPGKISIPCTPYY